MVIDGPLWFLGALVICGMHMLILRALRREQRQYQAWWLKYDAKAQLRHDEYMNALSALDRDDVDAIGWNLDGNRERGRA